MKPTQEELKRLFRYDPVTGQLRWRVAISNRIRAGAIAGNKNKGYIEVKANGCRFRAHRIIWCLVKGYWPEAIDHINRDGTDNRLCNLREASQTINMQNTSLSKRNKSGVKGVSYDPQRKKWRAYISGRHIGRYHSLQEAKEARASAEKDRRWGEGGHHAVL